MKKELQPGSIILVHNKGFLPSMIRKHMRLYGNLYNKGYYVDYNHAEVIVKGVNDGLMYTFSARASGGEMSLAGEYYKENPDILIMEPLVSISEAENERLWSYAIDVCFINKRKYQYNNFFAWIHALKVQMTFPFMSKQKKEKLMKMMFRKGDGTIYCFEIGSRAARLIDRGHGDPDMVSIYDIYENLYYKPSIKLYVY